MMNKMNKNELLKILEDWNFWKEDLKIGFSRGIYLEMLEKRLSSEQIKVIIGARRSGKSYIMKQFASWLIEKKGVSKFNILIVNFEDPRFTNLDTKLLQEIFDVYQETYQPKGDLYVFLDEVQEVANWEKWVRIMQELGKANLILSGSNSKLLSGELATVLTGRHLDTAVMPLSFKEFLNFSGLEIKNKTEVVRNDGQLNILLNEYLKFGSFPLVVLGQDKENILLSYFDDIVNKDLIKRYRIRKVQEIKSLLKLYLSNIATPITFSSSGKFLNISPVSVERFSAYLEASYAVFFLKRFSFKVKEQEKSPRKVYAVDTGLANVIGFRFSENSGRFAENLVFLELKRRTYLNPWLEIYYWKSLEQEEVDFLLKEENQVKQLLQVCWDVQDQNTKKREVKALLKAMKEFNLKEGLIITQDFEGVEVYEEKKIQYVTLRSWLLGL